jgi:hypothetical protein
MHRVCVLSTHFTHFTAPCAAAAGEPLETVPLEIYDAELSHHPGAEYPSDWVVTPQHPVVIRRGEDASSARYHECTGSTFLINSMKRCRLVRLPESGRLVLTATGWLRKTGEEVPFTITSDTDGRSWSQPLLTPHGSLAALGGERVGMFAISPAMDWEDGALAAFPASCVFSENGGDSWSELHTPSLHRGVLPGPAMRSKPDEGCAVHGSILVEGEGEVRLIAVADPDPAWEALGREKTEREWTAGTYLFHSRNGGRDWETPHRLPADWRVSEGSVARASDGALVAALRTVQEPGFPSYNDHWRRITIARSLDGGLTWVDRQVYFRSGKVHSDLITLADGCGRTNC